MKIDLCKMFGVEEGEEFLLDNTVYDESLIFKIQDNTLFSGYGEGSFSMSHIALNVVNLARVKKLPKKKQFTDDELAIMRSFDTKYKHLAKDRNGELYLFENKPSKGDYQWEISGICHCLSLFNHSFQCVQWEDEEPVFIDDYVKR